MAAGSSGINPNLPISFLEQVQGDESKVVIDNLQFQRMWSDLDTCRIFPADKTPEDVERELETRLLEKIKEERESMERMENLSAEEKRILQKIEKFSKTEA